MGKKQRHYSPEIRQQAIEHLETSGQWSAAIERDLGITEGLLSPWKRKANGHESKSRQPSNHQAQVSAEQRIRQLERENSILRQERDILKNSHHIQQSKALKFAFIQHHAQQLEVTIMCRVLNVSRSGFYDWKQRPPSQRDVIDQ